MPGPSVSEPLDDVVPLVPLVPPPLVPPVLPLLLLDDDDDELLAASPLLELLPLHAAHAANAAEMTAKMTIERVVMTETYRDSRNLRTNVADAGGHDGSRHS